MLLAIDMGWFIIDKYYNRTDEVSVYAAALLLDPQKRLAYIRKNWPLSWIDDAVAAANTIWEIDYKTAPVEDMERVSEMPPPPPINEMERLRQKIAMIADTSAEDDDFMRFINTAPYRIDCTPLEWWCRIEQRRQYPRLHLMAIAILSIPAESAEAERTISGSRRTCRWDRLSLTCKNIEIIECMGSWIREKLIRLLSRGDSGSIIEDEVVDVLVNEGFDVVS